jgi:hypothetical protein
MTNRQRSARWIVPAAVAAMLAALVACGGGRQHAAQDDPVCSAVKALQGPARDELLSIARLLAIRPAMAIDFSTTTGEYCLNTGGAVMTHFAARPDESSEDIVYFLDAAPLVAHGLRLKDFPPLDPEASRREPNVWYRYEGQGVEPHHGAEMQGRTWLVLAIDVR